MIPEFVRYIAAAVVITTTLFNSFPVEKGEHI